MISTGITPSPKNTSQSDKKLLKSLSSKPIKNLPNQFSIDSPVLKNSPRSNKGGLFSDETLKNKKIYQHLNLLKKDFGFKPPLVTETSTWYYPAVPNVLSSNEASKRLDAILYNNVYKNSKSSKQQKLIKHIEETYNAFHSNLKSERISPRLNELIGSKKEFRKKYD